jgi:bifunctional ADP-heptose synthase (sugar kinase/adenylyltransferase)
VDTRNKIVDAAQFARQIDLWRAASIPVAIASGTFDPLLAAHASLAAEARPAGGRLAVILTPPADPILDPRARAELAAALASVDLVTIAAPGLPPADLDWGATHASTAQAFVAHVLGRMS